MYTIYHNTRCSKSRAALQILEDAGVACEIRDYLGEPPTRSEIEDVLAVLSVPASAIVRTGEQEWKDSGLTLESSEKDIIAFLAEHPIVIERPIVVKDEEAAVIGRPPETVHEIL